MFCAQTIPTKKIESTEIDNKIQNVFNRFIAKCKNLYEMQKMCINADID